MAKVKKTSSAQKKRNRLSVINPAAAGIDIGDKIHAVAVPPDSCDDPVRTFGTMTCDLQAIALWLKEFKVNTVAMESTGVYWKPLFNLLIREGFEVYLVNARNVKNVSGRKTDESDAAWLQRLHSYGLLSTSYLPSDEQETLRTLVRFRRTLQAEASKCVLRIQKSLELMNVKLHTVISDIVGQTGTAILEAILNGERNAANLLLLVGGRIKASKEIIEKSLQGNWRNEHLFTLGQCYELYKEYLRRIVLCDKKIEEQLYAYEALRNDGLVVTTNVKEDVTQRQNVKTKSKNNPRFNVRSYLQHILGVDVLAIYGISDNAGLQLLAETGTDLSKWPTEKHFVSWLNLCPNNKVSGGKLISSRVMKKQSSIAGQAFRIAANSVQKSDHWLGDYFRRMKAKGGNKYAIVATANKLATIYYKMVRYQTEFNPPLLEQYQKRSNELKIKRLEKRLEQLKSSVV
jgi:transposase